MTVVHTTAGDYLDLPYLEYAFLDSLGVFGSMGFQALIVTANVTKPLGQQVSSGISDTLKPLGQQVSQGIADVLKPVGQQTRLTLEKTPAYGQQVRLTIDALKALGEQTKIVIADVKKPIGQQVTLTRLHTMGMEATVRLYNTKLLRVLCAFHSRGNEFMTGTNAWGNAAGKGLNWRSSSTAGGDFGVENLNTDFVEQTHRSANGVLSGWLLDCDTERTQGVYLDTLAILNHNLTTSATVLLIGSNSDTFTPAGVVIPLIPRVDDENIYYIAPELPITGYRYWRISVDDASNPNGHLEIGTVLFGASEIFFGECFVDSVDFQLKDYADLVNTEGFTNVANSRAQKKVLRLDFQSLDYKRGNFRMLRRMFRAERSVVKCLWIPTPDPVDQEYTSRFAVFAKMTQVPSEKHNVKGADADYVSFTVELDESR